MGCETNRAFINNLCQWRHHNFNLQETEHTYITERDMNGLTNSEQCYEFWLPKSPLKETFQDAIAKRIRENDGDPIRLVDLGCGKGYFLNHIRQELADMAEYTGINSFPYQSENLNCDSVEPIDISVLDITDLKQYFPDNYFDIAFSVWTFPYLSDPFFVVKNLYDTLKPGGFAFIGNFPLLESIPDLDEFGIIPMIKYDFKKAGLYFSSYPGKKPHEDGYSLWIEKTTSHLKLPLRFTGRISKKPHSWNEKLSNEKDVMITYAMKPSF